jgi:hypothetical protein
MIFNYCIWLTTEKKPRMDKYNKGIFSSYVNKNKFMPPKWWPDDPHVSFKYQYNIPIKDIEIEKIEKNIKMKVLFRQNKNNEM